MKYLIMSFAFLLISIIFPFSCLAHRVNIFAYPDGDAIQVETYFSKSQKVRHGKLIFSDSKTGEKLLEATTDDQGMFRFYPAASFVALGHDLNILLKAGQGHQARYLLSAGDIKTLSLSGRGENKFEENRTEQRNTSEVADLSAFSDSNAVIFEEIISRVMDAKLAPIRQELVRQADAGPDIKDIIGGLGWIFGLLGMATYIRYRR